MKRPSKYGNRKTVLAGKTFASAAEARRWGELQLMERAKLIRDLRCQVPFPLIWNGVKIASYVADFTYVDAATGAEVIEDVKGVRTQAYRIKAKMMAADGKPIKEVAV